MLGVGVFGLDMNFDRREKADFVDEKEGRAAASSLKSREKSQDLYKVISTCLQKRRDNLTHLRRISRLSKLVPRKLFVSRKSVRKIGPVRAAGAVWKRNSVNGVC